MKKDIKLGNVGLDERYSTPKYHMVPALALDEALETIDKLNKEGRELSLTFQEMMDVGAGQLESLQIQLKIQADALKNANEKINTANERIVEFERIKAQHLEMVKQLKEEIEDLKFELKYENDPEGI